MIMFIAIMASIFTGAFLMAGCGKVISDFLVTMGFGRWGIFFAILVILFIMGCFIDWVGILMITVPIFAPILMSLGFDSLWVGVVICTSLQISFLTPPFAYSIFYLKGLDLGLELRDMYIGIVPFVCLQILVVVIVIAFPSLILFLPQWLAE